MFEVNEKHGISSAGTNLSSQNPRSWRHRSFGLSMKQSSGLPWQQSSVRNLISSRIPSTRKAYRIKRPCGRDSMSPAREISFRWNESVAGGRKSDRRQTYRGSGWRFSAAKGGSIPPSGAAVRAVGRLRHPEVPHHPHVFVLEDMAVIEVEPGMTCECHLYANGLSG